MRALIMSLLFLTLPAFASNPCLQPDKEKQYSSLSQGEKEELYYFIFKQILEKETFKKSTSLELLSHRKITSVEKYNDKFFKKEMFRYTLDSGWYIYLLNSTKFKADICVYLTTLKVDDESLIKKISKFKKKMCK